MPGELENASAILGGKAWTTARRITIPLALLALVFCLIVLVNPVFLPYFALFNAAFSPHATTLALKNTLILGTATATVGTILALVIACLTTRRVVACSASSPPHRSPCSASALFLSYTRPPLVLYGTLWILVIAFLTINLPSAYQQL